MISNLTLRHRGIIDPQEMSMSIAIIGAGSIGSNLALLLARLGMEDITVYDFDEVEDHNLGHQAFRISDIGEKKVDALQGLILDATGVEIKTMDLEVNGTGIEADILIMATDSMESRRIITGNANYTFCIDGRMGGEAILVYAFSKPSLDRYRETLYTDDEASDAPCGGKSIGYVSYIISALMEITIKKIIMGEEFPFEQEFCAKNLIYNTKQ